MHALEPCPLRPLIPALFPLPIPHAERTDPLDFIPTVLGLSPKGEKAWEIFSQFRLTEGPHAGKFLGDHFAPWQKKLVELVYGYRDENDNRIIQEVFLLIGRKNGKTGFASIWVLAHDIIEPEERGQVVLMADVQKQAQIAYNNLAHMIERDDWLSRRFKVRRHVYQITDTETDTVIDAISSELSNIIGLGPSVFLADELHLIGARPKGEMLIRGLTTGQIARSNPLAVYISTQSMDMPSGIFASTLARARRLQRAETDDPAFLPVLFEPPEGATPHDRHWWWMANPSIGVTITDKRLEKDYNKALDDPDPGAIATFASQHLNIAGEGGARGFDRWIPPEAIKAREDESLTLDRILNECRLFWIAVDRGGMDDLEAVCIVGTESHECRQFYCYTHQIATAACFKKHGRYIPLKDFETAGELTQIERAHDDIELLRDYLTRVRDAGPIVAVGLDIHQAPQLKGLITEVLFEELWHVVPQGWKLHGGLVNLERQIVDEVWHFCPSSLFRWNMKNAVVKWAGNSKTLVKHGIQKIDGAMAWAMVGYLIAQRINEDRYSLGNPDYLPIKGL